MTLARGNHVLKLNADGKPLTTQDEIYIEFEILEIAPPIQLHDPNTGEFSHEAQFALLKKVR